MKNHLKYFNQFELNHILDHTVMLGNNIVPFNLSDALEHEQLEGTNFMFPTTQPLEILDN